MSDEQDRKITNLLAEWANIDADDPGPCPLSQDSAGWITSYWKRIEEENASLRTTLATERDQFGKKESELKAKLARAWDVVRAAKDHMKWCTDIQNGDLYSAIIALSAEEGV